ncbi:MAG: hypothetical protein DRR16_08425 [Candidatus Parabeggiatoa sp. nov. 3]|jgi:hypothetical protein|nr:MAG: hypothetical protein DRR00_26180 [Gammaproteobacteria bacterium]RKZ86950.1 MAG: hypothetical protein DRR16_08425 [Gammaproteobacteria bacterium]
MRLIFLVLLVFLSGCVGNEKSDNEIGLGINQEIRGEQEKQKAPKKDDYLKVALNYSYRLNGEVSLRPLKEGSKLHSGDDYTIEFTPKQDCHVYIFQYDSSDPLFTLFPLDRNYFKGEADWEKNRNPVKAGQTYFVPGKGKYFTLDENTGDETIHVLVSKEELQLQELEKEYEDLLESRPKSDKLGNDEQKNLLKCETSLCFESRTFKHLD